MDAPWLLVVDLPRWLVQRNVISDAQALEAAARQAEELKLAPTVPLLQVLIDLGFSSRERVLEALETVRERLLFVPVFELLEFHRPLPQPLDEDRLELGSLLTLALASGAEGFRFRDADGGLCWIRDGQEYAQTARDPENAAAIARGLRDLMGTDAERRLPLEIGSRSLLLEISASEFGVQGVFRPAGC